VVRLGNSDLEAPNTPAMDAPDPNAPKFGMMPPGMMAPGMMAPGMMAPGMMPPGMMPPGMMPPGMMPSGYDASGYDASGYDASGRDGSEGGNTRSFLARPLWVVHPPRKNANHVSYPPTGVGGLSRHSTHLHPFMALAGGLAFASGSEAWSPSCCSRHWPNRT
jgi:hypothetical protein